MRLLISLLAVAVIAAAAPQLSAAKPSAGDVAPATLGGADWAANAPESEDLASLKNNIYVVAEFGLTSGPSKTAIPRFNALQAKYGKKGLSIFAFQRDKAINEEVKAFTKQFNITFPMAYSGGSLFDREEKGLPRVWVVGVEGKVLWYGDPQQDADRFDTLIEAQMRTIKFPLLHRLTISAKVAAAATAFEARDFAKARVEAAKVVADKASEGDVLKDAQFVLDQTKAMYDHMTASAKAAEVRKAYLTATTTYESIVREFGAKSDEAKAATARLDAMKVDKDIQRELTAQRELVVLLKATDGAKAAVRNTAIDAFIMKWSGTEAAKQAAGERVKDPPTPKKQPGPAK